MTPNMLLTTCTLSLITAVACHRQPAPSSPTLETKEVTKIEDAQPAKKEIDPKTALAFLGPFVSHQQMCTAYKASAMSEFDEETLARWQVQGISRYSKPNPYKPKPRCDGLETLQESPGKSDKYHRISVTTGHPMDGDFHKLLAVETSQGWYLEDLKQSVPWHRAEVMAPHFTRVARWSVAEVSPSTIAFHVVSRNTMTGHPQGNCSSGGNGGEATTSLVCTLDDHDRSPRCTMSAVESKQWDSPISCSR